MSARMQVPLSQRRHTNVAIVRYTKNGVKLEIACYKNKVISFRSGVETRLDEVLQVERVFTNVSRGFYASEKEIHTAFGKEMSEEEALKYILQNGDLQVAQQERSSEVDQMFKDVAVIISQKCVNEVTQRPFPSQVIEQALRSIGAAVKLDQSVKKQALTLIHRLIESQIIPIARAQMKLRCIAPDEASLNRLTEWGESNGSTILEKLTNPVGVSEGAATGQFSLLILIPPHLFRDMEQFVKNSLPPGGSVHMVESAVMEFGEGDVMDTELISRANAHATVGGSSSLSSGKSPSVPLTSHCTGSENGGADNETEKKGKGRGKKKDKRKGSSGGRKKRNNKEDEDDNDNDYEEEDASGEMGQTHCTNLAAELAGRDSELRVTLSKMGLEETGGGAMDDESDGGKGNRGKKKKQQRSKGGQPQQQQEPPVSKKAVKFDLEDDSDEEVMVNRKQRKQAATKAKEDDTVQPDWDEYGDYDYDYNSQEEGETNT